MFYFVLRLQEVFYCIILYYIIIKLVSNNIYVLKPGKNIISENYLYLVLDNP